jgi:hypothetical protein
MNADILIRHPAVSPSASYEAAYADARYTTAQDSSVERRQRFIDAFPVLSRL